MPKHLLQLHRSRHRLLLRSVGALVALAALASACGSDQVAFEGVPEGSTTLVRGGDIEFSEISPFATFGSAVGQFGEGGHGTFGIFGAGAASPPHTHSGSYYAVVLSGDMNNPFGLETDPPMLSPGSFWAVSASDEHITACLTPDRQCRFFFHSDSAFDFTPIDALSQEQTSMSSAIPVEDLRFEDLAPYDGAATVWGSPDDGAYGAMVRLKAGGETGELAHRNALSLVPISGSLTRTGEAQALPVGSLLQLEANAVHGLSCSSADDCAFYTYSAEAREVRSE